MTQEETRNLPKIAQASKVVSPFTHALVPPFIGSRRDFYIPKVPSNPRNIPNVNTYMNVFYIPYIYKLATSSHAKLRLFEATSLTWLLAGSRVSPFRKSSYAATFELELQRIPEFRRLPISWFRRFMTPGLHRFATSGARRSKASDLHRFAIPELRRFQIPDLRRFKIPDLRKFATSELRRFKIPDLHRFKIPENSFHEFRKTRRFEGDMFS
jgi:hypothetical protein